MHPSYLWGLALLSGPPAGPAWEAPPVRQASRILSPALLRSPHHTVREDVPNDGLLDVFTLDTPWGVLEARGAAMLRQRVKEAEALAEVGEASGAAVAAGALGSSAVDVAKGAANVATRPVETAKGVGAGVKRLGGRLGRSARRVVEHGKEAIDEDDPERDAEGPERTKEEMAKDAATTVARSMSGVSRAFREWCRKLEVDPYTDNEPLREGIERLARYDAGGRFVFRALPFGVLGAVAGSADSVSDLVYGQDPDALATLNEQRLTAMGVSPELSREFRLGTRLGLSGQVRLVHALTSIGDVQERERVVRRAAAAPNRDAARFYEETASMMLALHEQGVRLRRVLGDEGPLTVHTHDGAALLLLPADHVSWTEELSRWEEGSRAAVAREAPGARLELRVPGLVSERARQEMEARGWTVLEAGGTLPR